MSQLILVRHGESRWNLANRFTGWVDVPLSQRGVEEAVACAGKLKGIKISHAFTSSLIRAQETLAIVLSEQRMTGVFLHANENKQNWYLCEYHSEKTDILTRTTLLLNERYYGILQGWDKTAARKKFGEAQIRAWRRGYVSRPPGGESLQDVYERAVPFFIEKVIPLLSGKEAVIIASHGNTLRAIIKYIEKISPENIPHLYLPFGGPIIYDYRRGKFSRSRGELTFDRPLV